MTPNLTRYQKKLFREQISKFFTELQRQGIVCKKNYMCCTTCATHSLSQECDDTQSYLYYHSQDNDTLKEGADFLYLGHRILEKDIDKVIALLQLFGGEWNGEETTKILLSRIERK